MPRSSRSWTASPAGCGLPGGSDARSCSGFGSPTSLARPAHTRCHATANTETILITARGLLAIATPMIERRGITLVGVAVSNLEDGLACQLALAIDRHSSDALDAAIDEVRQRFGSTAVTRAVLLGRGQGLTMPLLPD